jgi:hypothetical protein
MIYRLANFRPGDAGGEDVSHDDQGAGVQIDPQLADFIKKSGADASILDENAMKALLPLWKSRGEEIKQSQAHRKAKQELEAKLNLKQTAKLEEILPNLSDEDKATVKGWIKSSERTSRIEQSLEMLAEAGLPMTPEVGELVKAGPEATRAYIAAVQKNGTASNGNGGIDIDKKIEEMLAKHVGVGADQGKQQQDEKHKKKSALAEFLPERTKDHDFLDALREGADKRQLIGKE